MLRLQRDNYNGNSCRATNGRSRTTSSSSLSPLSCDKVSRRISSILSSAAACRTMQELVISRTRLAQTDMSAIVRFLASEQQQQRRQPVHTLTFKSCLLERMDVIVPLMKFLNKAETCHLYSICFTGVEVLKEEKSPDNTENNDKQYASFPTAYSCTVRPFLKQFPFSLDEPVALHKLTLQNVDLSGSADGALLAEFFAKSPLTNTLEMYQSILGPLGSRELCNAMTKIPETSLSTPPASQCSLEGRGRIEHLLLRYCSLDDDTGVADLVRHVGRRESSILSLGLHRNRSPPSDILPLLAEALQRSQALKHLSLRDSPFLFLVDDESAIDIINNGRSMIRNDFIQALETNRSLESLEIDRCGLPSSFVASLLQALESKADRLRDLRVSTARLGESGVRQLIHTLPLLHELESVSIVCSVGENIGVSNQARSGINDDLFRLGQLLNEFCNVAMQYQTSLTEFNGSGWLASVHKQRMISLTTRNVLLQRAQGLLSRTTIHAANCSKNEESVVSSCSIPLGLWPHALSRILQKTYITGSDEEETHFNDRDKESSLHSASFSGATAAHTILQSIITTII